MSRLTCLFVHGQVDGAVATRAELLLEEVLVLDVPASRLDEPGAVEAHDVLAALRCRIDTRILALVRLNHDFSFGFFPKSFCFI